MKRENEMSGTCEVAGVFQLSARNICLCARCLETGAGCGAVVSYRSTMAGCGLYSSHSIVRFRQAGYVFRMGQRRDSYGFLW